jgi:2-desacetyl-2-hydroxyethyl bacteriochlorophyllide A dehydrogenase
MKALYFDGQLSVRGVDRPKPGPGEALIQVLLAGICGTDREILKGYANFRGIPGHEFVGRVVECEEKKWLGKRVVGEINISCGECELCLWGLGRHCAKRTVMGIVNRDGVFAEFVTLPIVNLHEVPKTLSDEAAVFTEPLAAAGEILEQMQIPPGAHVAVIGDGRLGLLVAQVLHHAKAQVTVVGKHGWKLDLARGWGMKVASVHDSEMPARSFTVVVEATGSPTGLAQAFRLVAPRGTVVMKSTFHGRVQFDAGKLVVDEVTLLGSRCGDFRRALELLAHGHVKVQHLVSKTFPLEAGLEAFEYLESTSCLKVLLAPPSKRP